MLRIIFSSAIISRSFWSWGWPPPSPGTAPTKPATPTCSQAWADGSTNYGLLLISPDESDNYTWKKFRSSDASSNRPRLSVTYNSYPAAVTGRSATPLSGGFVPDVRPTLNGVFSDPDGGTGSVQHRVFNSAGSQVFQGVGTLVASGSNSPRRLPDGYLGLAPDLRGYGGTEPRPIDATRGLRDWSDDTETGDRDALRPGVSDRAWKQVSVSARECLGASKCAYGAECFAE